MCPSLRETPAQQTWNCQIPGCGMFVESAKKAKGRASELPDAVVMIRALWLPISTQPAQRCWPSPLSWHSVRMLKGRVQQDGPEQAPTIPKLSDVKPEILDLVLQDQWDRCNDMFGASHQVDSCSIKPTIADHDTARHAKAKELLAQGKVETGRSISSSRYSFSIRLIQRS